MLSIKQKDLSVINDVDCITEKSIAFFLSRLSAPRGITKILYNASVRLELFEFFFNLRQNKILYNGIYIKSINYYITVAVFHYFQVASLTNMHYLDALN